MLNQCRTAVITSKPVRGYDIIDGEPFYATKHWVVAEYCEKQQETTVFIDAKGDKVMRIPSDLITVIRIPKPTADYEWVTTRSVQNYRTEIRRIRPNGWNKWTDEEELQLWSEYHDGETIQEMSFRHGRTELAIWSRLMQMGLGDDLAYPESGACPANYRELTLPKDRLTWRICINCGLDRQDDTCRCWKSGTMPESETWYS